MTDGPPRRRAPWDGAWAALVAVALLAGTSVGRAAETPSIAPPPLVPAPVFPSPPPAPPAGDGASPAAPSPAAVPDAGPAAPAPSLTERRVPTLDAAPAESDHDSVGDSWGIQVRPVATHLSVFALRAATGCPSSLAGPPAAGTTTPSCPPVAVSALSARRWIGRNVAIDGGLALAVGGGSEGGRLLDTYFGLGPVIGASVLLANWRHVAVMAGPELTVVVFKGAGSADAAYLAELLGSVEAELHFGFIGAPALSLGVRSGLAFRLEHAADGTLWSVGVGGATTVRALFEDVALRYYF